MSRIVVIGGGPAGHAAALAAARRGASVVLVEGERVGGNCVNQTCIPSGLMLGPALAFLEAQELAGAGILTMSDEFRFPRARARQARIVDQLSSAISQALKNAGVQVIQGHARLAGHDEVEILGSPDEPPRRPFDAAIVATGSHWFPPAIPGVPPSRVWTLDAVLHCEQPPATALVLAGGVTGGAFSVECAVLLALAGSSVVLASPTERLVEGLDREIEPVLRAHLERIGIQVITGAQVSSMEGTVVAIENASGHHDKVDAEVIVGPDNRQPNTEPLRLELAGVAMQERGIRVDDECRSSNDRIFAAGDVIGGTMVTHAAIGSGMVAGVNATGGRERLRLGAHPRAVHTTPPTAWAGMTEHQARSAGYNVDSIVLDLSWSANAIVAGGQAGALKIVAERDLDQILGVHAVGADAAEIAAVGSTAIQNELTIHEMATTVHWHPSGAETLAEASRTLLASRCTPHPT